MSEHLPQGLTHPYGSRIKAMAYRHGYTFSWVPGDEWIAVQCGHVANASQRLLIVGERQPDEEVLLGRCTVVAVVRAPPVHLWYDARVLAAVADRWFRAKRQPVAAHGADQR
ncbi:hypothetical protein [Amycolatopsis cihanbeyliensis]|uniref:Uncharacterized protein n=1 Tax=Amycolatopsis cihanbeyliensis TaxID=1128664 RepID=A0A542DFQ8_AMYCI|nr:hypothetical protein [Amycolatopsis cihanbeyliensis]TQJ01861.1 hypothetical protein FB471_1577 [Amycolatopsis cihanbeyliensis]